MPTPTPTSLHHQGGAKVSDGLGIVGGLLFKLIMVLLANGIGFAVWWYTQTGVGDENAVQEPDAGYEDRSPEALAALEAQRAELERQRMDAMFYAADAVDWPTVMLSGMVAGSTPEKTSAILNGTLVSQHQSIEGVELISVDSDGVVLQFRNTRKYIRVGENT